MRSVGKRLLCALGIVLSFQVQNSPGSNASAAAAPLPLSGMQALSTLSSVELSRLSAPATDHVIVVLRNQNTANAADSADRAGILRELQGVGAKAVHSYQVINAIGATVSPAEAARLRTDAAVLSVAPDQVIHLADPAPQQALSADAVTALSSAALTPHADQPACTTSRTPSLEPEALQLTDTASTDPKAPQAQKLRSGTGALINGAGVKVAYIADGIDIYNPDFMRNGKSIFVDYKDFSGDGPNAPTSGGEAFLDASSIAAQGRQRYNVNDYLAIPWSKPCPIRILGMAPGVQLVGIKVFGQTNTTTTSAFVQAIDYAVNVDHVNVLNESFGGNPFPDLRNDPISIADANAVAAGVTVTISSGDAGVAGTIGSPGSDAGVITVGATTQFRSYTQVGGSGVTLGNGGYLDNNIASLSSAGFTQLGPRTVDVVAPGDSGWALCTPSHSSPPKFADCMDVAGAAPSSIEWTGGTSESAPLTAGEAALVIQAYRSTHHGKNPSPMVVKQIITGTATDLGIPATEQGAGLIDSYRAVQAALSYRDDVAKPAPRASRLLISDTTAFTATAMPNTPERFSFTVANTGGGAQRIAPRLQTLGKTVFHASYTRYLDPVSSTHIFEDLGITARAYVEQDFKVPAGTQQLNAAVAWLASAQQSSIVRLDLFDPSGRLAGFSDPQSLALSSGFGQVDVRNPGAGVWKAVIWTRAAPTVNSYHGAVQLSIKGSRFVKTGAVSPAAVVIQPGHKAVFTVKVNLPSSPGDRDDEVVFPTPGGKGTLLGAIPVSLRSLIALHAGGGAFSGTLTGGNGREGSPGQTLSYQFNVPAGLHDLELGLSIVDPNSNLEGVLVDPYGQPIDVQTMAAAIADTGIPSFYTGTMQFFRRDPAPGRWLFVLLINNNIGGSATSQAFHATIGFNGVRLQSRGIPNKPSVRLPAGKPVDAEILIDNTGLTSKTFFLDPRLATLGPVALQAPDSYSVTLPITSGQQLPAFLVPPEVSRLDITAQAPTPVGFDAAQIAGAPPYGGTGSPDVYQSSGSVVNPVTGQYVATVSIQAPEVAPGQWETSPEQFGPFTDGGAPPATVDVQAVAYGEPFDRQVDTSTGDFWSPFVSGEPPLTLLPGAERVVGVRFTPRGTVGTVVRGHIYVDTISLNSGSGDELAAIPYAYTIGPAKK